MKKFGSELEVENIAIDTMVLIVNILPYIYDIDKDNGILYVEEDKINIVNNHLEDIKKDKIESNTIDLKKFYKGLYTQEISNYLFDDVWCVLYG